jgi:hypothetical protein
LKLLRDCGATGIDRRFTSKSFFCHSLADLKRLATYCRSLRGQCDWLPDPIDVDAPGAERLRLRAREIKRLFAATQVSEAKYLGLSGPQRAAVYRLALCTGLRVNEIASLTAGDFDLDADGLAQVVTIDAARAKNRCGRVLKLNPGIVAWLEKLASQAEGDWQLLWPGKWWQSVNKMLRLDLEAARGHWLDAEVDADEAGDGKSPSFDLDEPGRLFDFNALRKSGLVA